MAPFLAMTSRRTFLRPSAQAAATPRMLRTADGAHAGFECGFSQSWPPCLQILKVPLAQPVPQPSPKLFDWVQIWGPRMTKE